MHNNDIFSTLVRIIVLCTAFPVHESAHALAAHWLGDNTAKEQGRITLNPFKHFDLFGTMMMLVAGVGWAKPVPINPANFKEPKKGMALSSFAGPLSNLILAYLSIVLGKITFFSGAWFSNAYLLYFFSYSALLNVYLAVFNLMPIPPLDGSRIITLILPEKTYFKIMVYERFIMFALLIAVFMGLLRGPLNYLSGLVMNAMYFLSGWVDVIRLGWML
ncbi:MAG: site-2 protease family protein [Oscillospiraceae bacterium]|nr:site-2 protease family protein [Oscillospiraceae bacterium]